jgi:hypothetical protein
LSPFEVTAVHATEDNSNFEYFIIIIIFIIMQTQVKGLVACVVLANEAEGCLRWVGPLSILCQLLS